MSKHYASHVPPPARLKAKAETAVPKEAIGAGVVAAVGLVWLLAPGFSQKAPVEDVREIPAAPAKALPMPERQAEMKAQEAAPQRVEIAPVQVTQAEERVEAEAPVQMPAWVTQAISQEWKWPKHIQRQGDDVTIDKKLVAWYPKNAAEKRLLYSVTVDRRESRLYEDELPAFLQKEEERILAQRQKAEELKELRKGTRVAPVARVVNTLAAPAAPAAPAQAAVRVTIPAAGQGAPRAMDPAEAAAMAAVQQIWARIRARQAAARTVRGDKGPRQLTPEELADHQELLKLVRGLERDRMVKNSAGAILAARDVSAAGGPPMVELTYKDGTKKTVPYDPLVFDLKGTGIKTAWKKVLFDLIGYGKADKTQWMNDLEDGSGVLVFDAKGTGRSGKTGAEVFGDRTDLQGLGRPDGYADGFAALRAFVEKAVKEGVIGRECLTTRVLDAKALKALEKAYGLKMKVGGMNKEPVSLESVGIEAIALSREATQRAVDFDGQDNDLVVQPGAVFLRKDGSTGYYMNVWLSAKTGNLGLKTSEHLNAGL